MSASLPLTPPLIAVFGRSKPFIFGELRNGTAEPRRSAAFFCKWPRQLHRQARISQGRDMLNAGFWCFEPGQHL